MNYVQAGDIIDIIKKNANGLWEGQCESRVGKFKFINVEMLSSSARKTSPRSDNPLPTTVPLLLSRLGLQEHIPKLVLNGYDSLTTLQQLGKEDLVYLGIVDQNHQTALLTAVDLIADFTCK